MYTIGHPWIKNYKDVKVPLDILVFKLMKTYMRSSSLRKAALRVCVFLKLLQNLDIQWKRAFGNYRTFCVPSFKSVTVCLKCG